MVVEIVEDSEGNLILPLSDELCKEVGWEVGDVIEWHDNEDGSWTMKKQETEIVLVDCVSTFRMRYAVEVPKGKSEWALDTVAMNEANELSQEHIGEQLVSHRVVSKEEYLRVFDQDNDYLTGWPEEQKLSYIKKWEEQEPAVTVSMTPDVEHSVYFYEKDRNR